jgi:hypothetical protein
MALGSPLFNSVNSGDNSGDTIPGTLYLTRPSLVQEQGDRYSCPHVEENIVTGAILPSVEMRIAQRLAVELGVWCSHPSILKGTEDDT